MPKLALGVSEGDASATRIIALPLSLKNAKEKPMSNGNDIIIKGGSVDIIFNDSDYPPGNNGSHKGQRKMQKIVVTDAQDDVVYDSESADVKRWTVTVTTGAATEEEA